MEEMNGKFSLVLEGHVALDEKMERFHKEAKEDHRLVMNLIKYSHDELKEKMRAVDERLTSEIRAVGAKVDGHEDQIRFLERKSA